MKLSIVIVTYKSGQTISKLINTLSNQTDKNFGVIVINNSIDDTKEIYDLVHEKKFVEFIQNPENTGYAGGNNIGLEKSFQSGSDWTVILNPDVEVKEDFVAQLKEGLKYKTGLVGIPEKTNGEYAYGGKIEWLKEPSKINYIYDINSRHKSKYVLGYGFCISKETYKILGPLDENYFLYYEDTDYSARAHKLKINVDYLENPKVDHQASFSTSKLGQSLLYRYNFRNALYFNWKNGPLDIKLFTCFWSLYILLKQFIKILTYKDSEISTAITKGVFDVYLGRMGKLPNPSLKRIGIECESIEGKNPMWGIGRIIVRLLEEISKRPELAEKYKFVLYFKDRVPDMDFLNTPIFEKKLTPVSGFPNRLFPIYYYLLLPIKLWFEELDLMFWPNYMLPIIAFGRSLVLLTEDVYYESHDGKLPFRYRLAYGIFGEWSSKFASRILAISETSKKELTRLYEIDARRIAVDHLGIDFKNGKVPNISIKYEGDYILYVGQAFPRRHLADSILAFEKIAEDHKELNFIAIGPDKYEKPTIEDLVKKVNKNLKREAVIHKDYVTDEELLGLYKHAKGLVYVSDREAFGLPPMEAITYGVSPIINDNDLGRELFGEYAFYSKSGSADDIVLALREALDNKDKQIKIKIAGKEMIKKYNWQTFTNRWLDIVQTLI